MRWPAILLLASSCVPKTPENVSFPAMPPADPAPAAWVPPPVEPVRPDDGEERNREIFEKLVEELNKPTLIHRDDLDPDAVPFEPYRKIP